MYSSPDNQYFLGEQRGVCLKFQNIYCNIESSWTGPYAVLIILGHDVCYPESTINHEDTEKVISCYDSMKLFNLPNSVLRLIIALI